MSLLQTYFSDLLNVNFAVKRATLTRNSHWQEVRTYNDLINNIMWYLTLLKWEKSNMEVESWKNLVVNMATHKLYTDLDIVKVGDIIEVWTTQYNVLFIYAQYDQWNVFDHNIVFLNFVVKDGV